LVFKIATFHISSAIPEIKSGIDGYCLDARGDSSALNATIDSWSCNGTDAQTGLLPIIAWFTTRILFIDF